MGQSCISIRSGTPTCPQTGHSASGVGGRSRQCRNAASRWVRTTADSHRVIAWTSCISSASRVVCPSVRHSRSVIRGFTPVLAGRQGLMRLRVGLLVALHGYTASCAAGHDELRSWSLRRCRLWTAPSAIPPHPTREIQTTVLHAGLLWLSCVQLPHQHRVERTSRQSGRSWSIGAQAAHPTAPHSPTPSHHEVQRASQGPFRECRHTG